MKKIRPSVIAPLMAFLGAVGLACGDYSSGLVDGGTGVASGSMGASTSSGNVGGGSTTAVQNSSGDGTPTTTTSVSGTTTTSATMGSSGTVVSSTSTSSRSGSTVSSSASMTTQTSGMGPCDILGAAGSPCVAAHSTVRPLYAAYTGFLYQVCKGGGAAGPNSCAAGTTKDIGIVGGFADAATQNSFCSGTSCTISIIYDQSSNHNDLKPAPAGGAKNSPDLPVPANALPLTISGHSVYGILIKPGEGYRSGCNNCGVTAAKGTATGDEPETEYMVTSQTNLVDGCCFDYGNGETDSHDDGNGTMEAVYFGGGVVWGTGSPGGHNNGPWVEADLENGLYAGWQANQDQNISTNTPLKFPFVTAVVVGDVATANAGKGRFALYGGDATSGSLTTEWDGIRPAKAGYVPMHKQGSIILGIGGDNSDGDGGQWYEGVMASGAATLPTLNTLQANIVAAGYGK